MEKYRKFIGKKVVIVLSLLCYLMACIFTPFYYSNITYVFAIRSLIKDKYKCFLTFNSSLIIQ